MQPTPRLRKSRAAAAKSCSSAARRSISKSLLRGVYQGPPADWDFRRQIEEELKRCRLAPCTNGCR